ncbi:hypothetical protein [Burkholderia oklahomensis]|nr:hypothetical protein [Burkholderia oklahomensis]QPS37650.1 hypothetical protein I6G57_01905 [Burkholderia oklahomensis]
MSPAQAVGGDVRSITEPRYRLLEAAPPRVAVPALRAAPRYAADAASAAPVVIRS